MSTSCPHCETLLVIEETAATWIGVCPKCDEQVIFLPYSQRLMRYTFLNFSMHSFVRLDQDVHRVIESWSEWLQKYLHVSNYTLASACYVLALALLVIRAFNWPLTVVSDPVWTIILLIVAPATLKQAYNTAEPSDVVDPAQYALLSFTRNMRIGFGPAMVLILQMLFVAVIGALITSSGKGLPSMSLLTVYYVLIFLGMHFYDTQFLPPSSRVNLFENNFAEVRT